MYRFYNTSFMTDCHHVPAEKGGTEIKTIDWEEDGQLKPCDSPIEKLFGSAWLDLLWYSAEQRPVPCGDYNDILDLPEITETTLLHRGIDTGQVDFFLQQQRIEKYRADFVIGRVVSELAGDGDTLREVLRRLPLVIVECDGHDFHEKTKAQAQHDKARDRILTAHGFRILRFTGSEIFRDPHKCAEEVDSLFKLMRYPRASKAANPRNC